jgi:hypothetical protein
MVHSVPRFWRVASLLLLCQPALLCAGDKAAGKPKPDPNVDVQLRLSVATLDPLKTEQAFIECIVRNKSDKAVAVPTLYAGGYDADLVVWADGEGPGLRHELRLVFWAGPKQQHRSLKPGDEATVFKALLKDVLLLEVEKDKPLMPKEGRYYWSWSA